MKIYDCFGTFDPASKTICFAVQTTLIGFDTFTIKQYYDISNSTRFALVAILETEKGNDKDLSVCETNTAMIADKVLIEKFDTQFIQPGDKKIVDVTAENRIDIYIHHAIGFDPKNNDGDLEFIQKYKDDNTITSLLSGKCSPPAKGGKKGVLIPVPLS